MKLVSIILAAVKEVFLSFTPNRSLLEAMMRFDFKVGDPRKNLMQLSFSPLASWPLFILLGLVWLSSDKSCCLYSMVSKVFGDESAIRYLLLDGRPSAMLSVFLIFFILEWILRKEYLLIALPAFFLSTYELHLHLAVSAAIGVYLSRSCYLWWFHIELESLSRKIWIWATTLQFVATVVVSVGSLWALDSYQFFRSFSPGVLRNGTEFLIFMIFSFQFFIFLFLSLWGHFSYQKKVDPSFLPIYFSTTTWILRFKMSFLLKKQLKEKTAEGLKVHMKSLQQLQEMKDQSPGVSLKHLEEVLNKELVYLQTSASRLTIG